MKGGRILKQFKKPMLVAALAGLIGVSSLGVSQAVHAQSDGHNPLVDKIAAKFNLNKDDVAKVFDENRTEHATERKQEVEQELNQAVANGQITSQQKDEVISKLKELKSFFRSLKDKSPSERKTALEARHIELLKWAKDNHIPKRFITPRGMHDGSGSHKPDFDHDGPHSPQG